MFYFETLFQTALNGIDNAHVTAAVLSVATTILLLSILVGFVEAFFAGGDVRLLAASGMKYLIVGLVFASYGTAFRDVNGMFNSIADFVNSQSGVGDLFSNWMGQLAQYWQQNGNASLWNLVVGEPAGVVSVVLIILGFVLFPLFYTVFTVFYAVYGSILYVSGPFVLALMPSRGLGQLSRTYLVNMLTFQAWGLIYAVLQVLMSAINLSSPSVVLNANGVLNSFVGSTQMVLLALTTILFSFSIALIPYIASRIVRGEVGSTLLTVVGGLTAAASTATAALTGVAQGAAAGGAAAGGSGGGGASRAASTGAGSSTAPPFPQAPSTGGPLSATSASSSSTAPAIRTLATSTSTGPTPSLTSATPSSTPPSQSFPASPATSAQPGSSPSRAGQFRGFNLTHAVAWYAGRALGSGYRQIRG